MNKNYIFGILGALVLLLISCEREDQKLEVLTATPQGQWQVVAYVDDSPVSGSFILDILESASQIADSISISEKGNDFWNFAVNAKYNTYKGTFQTDLSICQKSEDEFIGVKIENGKIIAPDSIYFEIKFEDDVLPFETTYQLKGRKHK